MALHQPMPTGGLAKNIVYLDSDGNLTDTKPAGIADGTGSTGTLLKVGGTGRPQTTAQFKWQSIGYDADGYELFIPVWK